MSYLTFGQLQEQQRAWVKHNFGDRPSWMPLAGAAEEIGELAEAVFVGTLAARYGALAHAHLKDAQGIRGSSEEHTEKAKDAVADIVIFLSDYCSARGWDFQEIVETTWARVRQRDFKADARNGGEK